MLSHALNISDPQIFADDPKNGYSAVFGNHIIVITIIVTTCEPRAVVSSQSLIWAPCVGAKSENDQDVEKEEGKEG